MGCSFAPGRSIHHASLLHTMQPHATAYIHPYQRIKTESGSSQLQTQFASRGSCPNSTALQVPHTLPPCLVFPPLSLNKRGSQGPPHSPHLLATFPVYGIDPCFLSFSVLGADLHPSPNAAVEPPRLRTTIPCLIFETGAAVRSSPQPLLALPGSPAPFAGSPAFPHGGNPAVAPASPFAGHTLALQEGRSDPPSNQSQATVQDDRRPSLRISRAQARAR